ncbi:PREDICTED: uncharacterized protein LOC109329318 [Lupinus angustifolius]|uniref:uncharacterized protein LOC109329318 n=1 Tax=Lupinus angustifolius TaxID=3871 RepID=UPI00092EBB5F|nr:PREDICTED: uncharacterized protein LOC109329318 [Lupinus angustifolius]
MEDSGRFILDRVFWAFKPCIDGFAYCKPIIQVDGTFLTGKYTGTLLIASPQDGNRRVFLVAFAIVEGETKEVWECNFNKEFRVSDLKDKVIQMGYELMRPRFKRMLNLLRQKHPKAGAWALPITTLVRETYYRLNEWFIQHRDEATSMIRARHIYCEELTKVIKENQRQSTCQVVRNFSRETGVSEVEVVSRSGGRQVRGFTIKLADSWCDCGEFQSLRLSCSHAIATCVSLALDCSQFISPIYRLDNIVKAYGCHFQPIGNEEYWPPYSGPIFIPNPLMRRNRSGRPKIIRIHNEMDEVHAEQIKKCGWCRTYVHNRETCPLRSRELGESSTEPFHND